MRKAIKIMDSFINLRIIFIEIIEKISQLSHFTQIHNFLNDAIQSKIDLWPFIESL